MPFGGLLTAGILGFGASITGSEISANAAHSAAAQQQQATRNALDFQKQVYNTQLSNAKPYLNAGTDALSTLESALPSLTQGFDPAKAGLPGKFSYTANDFHQDPGFVFALQQGQQAIDRSAAARGGDVSGGTLKSLAAYTTGMADQNYGAAYSRALGTYQQNYSNAFNTFQSNQSNTFNRLGSLVNTGLSANGQAAGAGANFANAAGNYAIDAGNAGAAGTVGAANAYNSGISGAVGSVTNGILLNQQLQLEKQRLLQQNGAGNGSSYVNQAQPIPQAPAWDDSLGVSA
jgi:hypothetical protein